MTKKVVDQKVLRIQADRLCTMIGLEPGTKIDIKVLRELSEASLGDVVMVNGKEVNIISPSVPTIAQIILGKI